MANAVVKVLMEASTPLKVSETDEKVAQLLGIPADVLEIEDANCTGSEFGYQMRWIRTDLKKKGIIDNPSKGYWEIR